MGTRGIKICACCRRSFRPQISDADMLHLFYTEEQIEHDREHEEETGHSHLGAPFQDLCAKCASDPNLELMGGFFGGPQRYRIRDPKDKPKKLKVKDMSHPVDAHTEHKLTASDGTRVTMTGSSAPPPQEIVDMMASLSKTFQKGGPKQLMEAMEKVDLTNQPQKKRPWWAFWKKP